MAADALFTGPVPLPADCVWPSPTAWFVNQVGLALDLVDGSHEPPSSTGREGPEEEKIASDVETEVHPLIIIRATTLTERTHDFGQSLSKATDLGVGFMLDGRHPTEVETKLPIISVTRQACEDLGLFCPVDFTWRCGDYGLYLARRTFPDVPFFWLFEYDVRLAGGAPKEFFDTFASARDDLLVAHYGRADPQWRWYSFASGRNVTPFRCLFPVVRLSATALDLLLRKRIEHSKSRQRRATWPNDEGFVATTLSNSALACRDLNDLGATFYNAETFTFFAAINGDQFEAKAPELMLYHPVLFGGDYERKMTRLQKKPSPLSFPARLEQRLRRPLNHLFVW